MPDISQSLAQMIRNGRWLAEIIWPLSKKAFTSSRLEKLGALVQELQSHRA